MKKNIPDEIVWMIDHEVDKSGAYYAMMACSGILTAIALLTNSVPVLIGAMAVAPLLAPIQLVAFGVVSGHYDLTRKGIFVSLSGLLVATFFVGGLTMLLNVSGVLAENDNLVDKALLEERVRPGIYSLIVPLAAGVAGTLAMIKKKMDALVGVVASVALVPAAGAGIISLISADSARALGGMTLFIVNYIMIIGVAIMLLSMAGWKISQNALDYQREEQRYKDAKA